MLHPRSTRQLIPTLCACFLLAACAKTDPSPAPTDYTTWGSYLGDEGRRHYSSLAQIDTTNVADLEVAWTYRSGDAGANTRIQANPLYADGRVYVITAGLRLAALDASSGTELWRYSPFADSIAQTWGGQSRGAHLWRGPGDRLRVVWAVGDRVHLLDAATGTLVDAARGGFGDGTIDLRAGLTATPRSYVLSVTTPGVVFEDVLVLGFMTREAHPAVRGSIRAFDLHTGEEAWRFNTIPDADDPAAATWQPEQLARAGGANNWCGMALDEASATLYVPTGTAVDDFYGGDRLGDNLYANCLIAIDVRTGQRRWHQKLVRHDVWDRDLPSPPTLVEVTRNGRRVEAVAQPTKHGYLFVFDRHTGEPLYDLQDVATPPSTLEGELLADAQPAQRGVPLLVRQDLSSEDLNPSARNADQVAAQFASLRRGLWEPPSEQGTLMSPGYDGGASWGGAATVPESGVVVINVNERPSTVRLARQSRLLPLGEQLYGAQCASCHGSDRQGGVFHGAAPALRDLAERYSHVSMARLLHTGYGAMPAFASSRSTNSRPWLGMYWSCPTMQRQ